MSRIDVVLDEANRLLATARLAGDGHRWLSGEWDQVLIGSTGDGNGTDKGVVVTVAPRGFDGTVEGTVVELTGASGEVHRSRLDAAGQAVLSRPAGNYRLSLRAAGERHALQPRHQRRQPARHFRGHRLARAVPVVAAAMAVVLFFVGTVVFRSGAAVASVDIEPVDCAKTVDKNGPGRVVVAGVWAKKERKLFTEVLERFEASSNIDVTFVTNTDGPDRADRRIGTTLDGYSSRGCPPDVAVLPQPGLLRHLAGQGRLHPLDEATERLVAQNYSRAWRDLAKVGESERTYGVWFKAASKSTIWYDVDAFARAKVTAPLRTWRDLKDAAAKLESAEIPPFSVGGADGWTLTDWFENVYLRMSPADYEALSNHDIKWTDQSVKNALATLAEIFGEDGWLASNPLGTTYEQSVRQVFDRKRPKAAMVFEGAFVANEIDGTGATLGKDVSYFDFPSIDAPSSPVVGTSGPANDGEAVGGDVAVLMRNTPEAIRLLQFLATPEAAEPWVRAGGFTSPNNKVELDAYPDEATRAAAHTLVAAEELSFDLSDMQCPAFGSDPKRGMWPILQDFLRNPESVAETAQRLEDAWLPPPGRAVEGRTCPVG
jgi:alpha-glucoside transport system substrate-binding protein